MVKIQDIIAEFLTNTFAVSKENWTGNSVLLGSLLNSETVWLEMTELLTWVSFLIISAIITIKKDSTLLVVIRISYPSGGNIVSRLHNFTLTAVKFDSEEKKEILKVKNCFAQQVDIIIITLNLIYLVLLFQ